MMSNGRPTFNNRHLRFIFVAFLFSFAIREIAVGSYALLQVPTSWELRHLPGASHLLVAFFAITMSWVYWAKNIGHEEGDQLEDVFSRQYGLLLLDLLLVVLYFALARFAEVPRDDGSLPRATAIPESALLAAVYFIYVCWDLIHDIVGRSRDGEVAPRAGQWVVAILVRTGASLVCLLLALGIVVLASTRAIHDALMVSLLNVAEFANLVVFRSLKSVEPWAQSWLNQRDRPLHARWLEREDKYPERIRDRMQAGLVIGLIVYTLFFGAVWFLT